MKNKKTGVKITGDIVKSEVVTLEDVKKTGKVKQKKTKDKEDK